MAKKKRKKAVKKSFNYSAEIAGIILILIAILGIGKYGPVGRLIASFGLFIVGSLYNVFLVVLFIVGGYLLLKREWPDFFSTKLVGLYIFVLGLLIMMHREFILENDGNIALIFKETIDQLVMSFNSIMNTGTLENWLAVGGGLIGGVLAALFVKLFSYQGMHIVSWVFMIAGVCLFTSFSIIDFIKNSIEKSKEIKIHKKEAKEKKSSVIISDGAEEEESDKKLSENNHIKITSIDELTKVSEKNEKVDVTPVGINNASPSTPKEPMVCNLKYQLPPLSLLDQPKKKQKGMDNAAIEKNIVILEQVLKDFKIVGKVVEVHIGPSVAQYELEIASGTRVNKITSINREIALALAKKDVRIEAPIPGKNTVGIKGHLLYLL